MIGMGYGGYGGYGGYAINHNETDGMRQHGHVWTCAFPYVVPFLLLTGETSAHLVNLDRMENKFRTCQAGKSPPEKLERN